MSNPLYSNLTLAYYDDNAAAFSCSTGAVDMSHLYNQFLPLVPTGGRILDAGCGSGRDAMFFKKKGFVVSAFDASRAMAAIAAQSLGQPVPVMSFLDLDATAEFEGIWACASLLHVPSSEMDNVLNRLSHALKLNAPLYASFKHGTSEGMRNSRFFNDCNEVKLRHLLSRHPDLKLVKLWLTPDARPDRESELWLNAIVTKQPVANH